MEITDLIERFSHTREQQVKAIFSTLFIAENKLQTLFDREDPNITLKQFMLLTMVRQSDRNLTLTHLGNLLGCSRQNVKKVAAVLEKKGFVEIVRSEKDVRASVIVPTEKLETYFKAAADSHRQKLGGLFQDYTDEEIAELFRLLMKIYDGIKKMESCEADVNKREGKLCEKIERDDSSKNNRERQ